MPANISFKSSKITAKKPLTTKPATIVPNEPAAETDVSRKSDAAKNPTIKQDDDESQADQNRVAIEKNGIAQQNKAEQERQKAEAKQKKADEAKKVADEKQRATQYEKQRASETKTAEGDILRAE